MPVDLDVLRVVIARVGVDVVRFQVGAIQQTAIGGSRVSVTVCVESWFSEVGCHRTIRKESSFEFQIFHSLQNVSLLKLLKCSTLWTLLVSSICLYLDKFLSLSCSQVSIEFGLTLAF